MNKLILISITILIVFDSLAINNSAIVSILDPNGKLSEEDRKYLKDEGQRLMANRMVNGQNVLIQIDFVSQDDLKESDVSEKDENFLTQFTWGTYMNWSIKYVSQPAILILFKDQGNDQYILDAVNFSSMLMDYGIPDLVRRYIRDEIMKKETEYTKIISKGLYAFSEALNPIYKERLVSKGLEMLNTDKRYQRAHCVYGDCNYYEFVPGEENSILPVDPKAEITFINLPEERSTWLESVIVSLKSWKYTHGSEIVSNWPWSRDMNFINTINEEAPDGYFPIKTNNPWSVLYTNFSTKDVGELLPRMAWYQIHGWRATYCNFFAQDLSKHIFGHLPWGEEMRANDIHSYILKSNDFIEILSQDVNLYTTTGFMCYYTQYGIVNPKGNRGPGHIATTWIEEGMIIQAGDQTGVYNPNPIFASNRLKIHLYLGFLRNNL